MKIQDLSQDMRQAVSNTKLLSHSIHCSVIEAVENAESEEIAKSYVQSEMTNVVHQAIDVLMNVCGLDSEAVGGVMSQVMMERF